MSLLSNDQQLSLKELFSKWDPSVLNPGMEYELEMRLGVLEDKKFKPGMTGTDFPKKGKSVWISSVDKSVHDKVISADHLFKGGIVSNSRDIVWMTTGNKIRMVKVLDKNNKVTETKYESKERISMETMSDLGVRVALNIESKVDPNNVNLRQFNFIRFRQRISRISVDGLWRYDFTNVVEREFGNIKEAGKLIKEIVNDKPEGKYEVEIEYIGKQKVYKEQDEILTSCMKQIEGVVNLINPDIEYTLCKNKVYTDIYNLISDKNYVLKTRTPGSLDFTRDLISKPVTLQLNDLGTLEVNKYSATEKADGERNLLFVDENSKVWLINSRNEVIIIKTSVDAKNWLIDGEYLPDLHLFAAFDCIIADGKDITRETLEPRLDALQKIVKKFEPPGKDKYKIEVVMKKFHFGKVFDIANKVLDIKYPYEIDGIIFTPLNAIYQNRKTFKWKRPEMTTTDFLVRRHSSRVEGNKKIIRFQLYVSITRGLFKKLDLEHEVGYESLFPKVDENTNYFPVLFQPKELKDAYVAEWSEKSVDKHDIQDDTIIELSLNIDAIGSDSYKKWKFIKTREDKTAEYKKYQRSFGNAWLTAMSNLDAVLRPVTELIIRGKVKAPFFTGSKESNIKSMRKFHNYIKDNMYQKYVKNSKWLLEVAAGRFADLGRWAKNDVKNVVAFDMDEAALKEGQIRVDSWDKNRGNLPKILSTVGDAGKDWTHLMNDLSIKKEQFDVISMQFAIHFVLGNENMFKEFLKNVKKYLKPGGIFMASALDGESVMNLFKANNVKKDEIYDMKKDVRNELKTIISIKKECVCDDLANTGQEIAVFVESIGSYTHKEYMVNFQYMIRTFQQEGFELLELADFEQFYKDFENDRREEMSDVEKLYSFMGRFMVVRKL